MKQQVMNVGLQLALMCTLAGCSPDFKTVRATAVPSPEMSPGIFTSFDNSELPLRTWLPSTDITAVIIALHGLNDYSKFMSGSARFLNNRQIAVYAYDQRGFGETATRGLWAGRQALAEDLSTLITLVHKKHPDLPLYILGDSMGGAVTIVTMVRKIPPEVDGVILVAPAVWARSEMPVYQRAALWLGAHLLPWQKVSGQSLDIVASDNIEMLRELGKDPLVIKETRIDVLYGLSNLMDEAYRSAEKLKLNALILYGEKDQIIPRKPVISFYQRLPMRAPGQQEIILYSEGYHMLMRDLQGETVMQDIVAWITEQRKN